MKHITVLLAALLFGATAMLAQTTAQNWTKTDCSGTSHTLFDQVDSGKIVVMEFMMIGTCQPCINAGNDLKNLSAQYQTSNPGRFVVYGMAGVDTYSCPQVSAWESTNGFTFPAIIQCETEMNYYGGLGMPTIIVVAGKDHKVIYQTKGWSANKSAQLKSAVDSALSATSAVPNNSPMVKTGEVRVFPNPSMGSSMLKFSLDKSSIVSVDLLDVLGNTTTNVFQGTRQAGEQTLEIQTSSVPSGMYFVRLKTNGVERRLMLTVAR